MFNKLWSKSRIYVHINLLKTKVQIALFKDPVRTAL